MARISRFRGPLCALALVLGVALTSAAAPAAIDMVDGARNVVAHKPVSDCSANAKAALNAVMQNAFEAGAGTGQWLAYGTPDSAGRSYTSAAIHCFPVNDGYVVTFTCAAEIPTVGDTASALCAKLTAAFGTGTTPGGHR